MNEMRLEIVFANALQVVEVRKPIGKCHLDIVYDGFQIRIEGDYAMYTLPVDHFVKMQVSYSDAAGNPARIDGQVTWASSNEAIATVTPDTEDSSIVAVRPAGALGQVQVTATADADLGEGVRSLITVADIEVVAGEAVVGTISPVGPAQPV